jgi:hypothetical protein
MKERKKNFFQEIKRDKMKEIFQTPENQANKLGHLSS